MKMLLRFFDDFLLLAGCACVVYGISLYSVILAWIVGGLVLIGLSFLVGKVMANHVD